MPGWGSIVNEFFSTVSGLNFGVCVISTQDHEPFTLQKLRSLNYLNNAQKSLIYLGANSQLLFVCLKQSQGKYVI